MSYTLWLRKHVNRLEEEIRTSPVFESERPATQAELRELHAKVVLHTYLKQQLLRRQTIETAEEMDTQELVLVRKKNG